MEPHNALQIKSISELDHMTEMVPTIETWQEFRENNLCAKTSGGYVDGCYDMMEKLEKIVTLNDFNQMKDELTKLYVERHAFLSYALDH